MAYRPFTTAIQQGKHAGLAAYTPMMTRNYQGFRGLGAIGPTSVTIGPDGQWQVSSGSQPTGASLVDQITQWLGGSTVFAGVPNSLIAIGGLILVFAGRGRRRRF